jgi:catechol 2,3-dioxygenase-like lactoylglutathione lyase family enzyme
MPQEVAALTTGVDHVGLAVADLARSRAFFIECLSWQLLGERPDYPAAFVGDGHTRITLWQVADPATCIPFDRRRNVGLHHLALKVPGRAQLDALHARVAAWPGVVVEFAPELSGGGPKWHAMIREPGGCRIEFAWDPR